MEATMVGRKYEKLIQRQPWGTPDPDNPDPNAPAYIAVNHDGMAEGWDDPFVQVLRPVLKPLLMIEEPHTHDCAEYLYFIGGNPMDFTDFGAEIELTIGAGDDAETYTIDSTTWVYIPKGVPHCPLNFKRVDKPIMFGMVMFARGFSPGSHD